MRARLFMFSDIPREVEFAKVDSQLLETAGVKSGGGNFLTALGLLSYTEFGGKIKFGVLSTSVTLITLGELVFPSKN